MLLQEYPGMNNICAYIRRALPRACQITSLAIRNMKQPSSKCQRCSAILFCFLHNFHRFRIQIMFFYNEFEQCFNSCSNNCFLFERCAREGGCQGAPGHWNRVLFESVCAVFSSIFSERLFSPRYNILNEHRFQDGAQMKSCWT